MWTSSRNGPKAFFLEEDETAELGSAEARGIDEDRVEDWLQVVGRVRNGAQHLRDCRLLLDEFGHPILRLRSGPFSVDTLVQAEQFLGLDGEGSITAPAAVRDSSHGRPNRRCGQTSNVRCGVNRVTLTVRRSLPIYPQLRKWHCTAIAGPSILLTV